MATAETVEEREERTMAALTLVEVEDVDGHAAAYRAASGNEPVDLAARQLMLQMVFDWVRPRVDEDLAGVQVHAVDTDGVKRWIPLVKPTGRIVVTIDGGTFGREARSTMGGHYSVGSYLVEGETLSSINVNSYQMNRDPVEVVATIAGEYLKHVLTISGVRGGGTSRQGRYLGRVYQSIAGRVQALDVVAVQGIGCVVTASQLLRSDVREELQDLSFGDISKILEAAPKPRAVAAGTVKLVCSCGSSLKVPKDLWAGGFKPVCHGGFTGSTSAPKHKGMRMTQETQEISAKVARSGVLELDDDDDDEGMLSDSVEDIVDVAIAV